MPAAVSGTHRIVHILHIAGKYTLLGLFMVMGSLATNPQLLRHRHHRHLLRRHRSSAHCGEPISAAPRAMQIGRVTSAADRGGGICIAAPPPPCIRRPVEGFISPFTWPRSSVVPTATDSGGGQCFTIGLNASASGTSLSAGIGCQCWQAVARISAVNTGLVRAKMSEENVSRLEDWRCCLFSRSRCFVLYGRPRRRVYVDGGRQIPDSDLGRCLVGCRYV